MPIFLHFLNREPYRAVHSTYSVAVVESALRSIALSTCEDLLTNLSNLLEGGLLAPGTATLAKRMLECGQIVVEGERPSLNEFLESRAERYGYDSARYPMYYGPLPDFPILISRVRSVSVTGYLADEINRVGTHQLPPREAGLGARDSSLVLAAASDLRKVLKERTEQAITRSLFKGKLPNEQAESATARLISTLYIKRYMTDLRCDIATGVPGLSAFDHLGNGVWTRDVRVLNALLVGSGFEDKVRVDSDAADEFIAKTRGSDAHILFCNGLRVLCEVGMRMNDGGPVPATSRIRELIAMAGFSYPKSWKESKFYEAAAHNLFSGIARLRRNNTNFAAAYEEYLVATGPVRTVLLVTATTAETRALREICRKYISTPFISVPKQDYIAIELGQLGGLRLVHVQCEPGSAGAANSQAVISDAIRDYSPVAIIMGGIAFGTNRTKQQLGDVLISKVIVEYERAKVTEHGTIPRGQRIECAPKLLSLFREADAQALHGRMHFGVMLSGEKLVDSESFLQGLLTNEPEAIGGEMEGAGLVGAAKRASTDWIVVKAIVDWGMNKASNNAPDHQENIAREAFGVIFSALDKIGL